MTLPNDACSFWARQEFRNIDVNAFGYRPTVSPEAAEAYEEAQDAEDRADQPCGGCSVCVESTKACDDEPNFRGAS